MDQMIKIFENEEFGRIRTVIKDGEPWFVGKDIAQILGYSDVNKAIQCTLIVKIKNSTTKRRRVLVSVVQH